MTGNNNNLKTPSLPSVPRALEVLEHIAASQNGLNLTQLTRALGFPRSTLHCLLLTLERSGYLQRSSQRGLYVCGTRLLELSGKALSGSNLREAASSQLRSLMQRTRLIVHMAVLERDQVMIIAQTAPPGARLVTSIGQRMELHCTALGKAMAAFLPEERLTEILSGRGLCPHNDRTIVSQRRFSEELTATRQRGYAVDDEEDAIGIRCLAAAVFDHSRMPVAAISVMGSTLQISEENAPQLAAELMRTSERIANRLVEKSAQTA